MEILIRWNYVGNQCELEFTSQGCYDCTSGFMNKRNGVGNSGVLNWSSDLEIWNADLEFGSSKCRIIDRKFDNLWKSALEFASSLEFQIELCYFELESNRSWGK